MPLFKILKELLFELLEEGKMNIIKEELSGTNPGTPDQSQ
jgi:hypothetical protein